MKRDTKPFLYWTASRGGQEARDAVNDSHDDTGSMASRKCIYISLVVYSERAFAEKCRWTDAIPIEADRVHTAYLDHWLSYTNGHFRGRFVGIVTGIRTRKQATNGKGSFRNFPRLR